MKNKLIACLIFTFALVCCTSCGSENKTETGTTSAVIAADDPDIVYIATEAETTPTKVTTTTTESTTVPAPVIFTRGTELSDVEDAVTIAPLAGTVWMAYVLSQDGSVDTAPVAIYTFRNDTAGSVTDPTSGTGVPFGYEQNNASVLFHFGSIDDNTPAVLSDPDLGSRVINLEFKSGNSYQLYQIQGADPETYVDSLFE